MVKKAKISSKVDFTKIILVCILLILIGFAVVYIFNITKLSKTMEKYQNGALANAQQSQENVQFLKYEYRDADAQKHMKYVDGFPTVLFYSSADSDDAYVFKGKSTGNQPIGALQANMQQYFTLWLRITVFYILVNLIHIHFKLLISLICLPVLSKI